MTHNEIVEMLEETNLPIAYDHFAEGESPDPPFICFLFPGSDNFSADGRVYLKIRNVNLELYTDLKDPELEERLETVLDRHGIFYQKSEVWIEEEKLYEVRIAMPKKKNKVKFNICNVHYAILTVADDGTFSFGTPVPMPGAVSLALDANGEPTNFYADGYAYYTIGNNMGYEGDLELAMVPESFRTDVLGEQLDANGVLIENANTETVNFALLFEFDGDIRKIRHVLYKCAASRPSVESKTNEEEVEVQTETLSVKATPMANGCVKAKTGDDTTDTVYQNWYSAVYLPVELPAEEPANG